MFLVLLAMLFFGCQMESVYKISPVLGNIPTLELNNLSVEIPGDTLVLASDTLTVCKHFFCVFSSFYYRIFIIDKHMRTISINLVLL